MKNYFSDRDVQVTIDNVAKIAEGEKDIALSYADVKSLMNLAVETAIGSKLQDYSTILNAIDEGRASIIVEDVNDSIDGGVIYADLDDAIEAIKELDN